MSSDPTLRRMAIDARDERERIETRIRKVSHDAEAFDEVFDPSTIGGFFLAYDNSEPPQLWVWKGEVGDESAEPWQRVSE